MMSRCGLFAAAAKKKDPLILDRTGAGNPLSASRGQGPRFDVNGDGVLVNSGWTDRTQGILVKLASDGSITSGDRVLRRFTVRFVRKPSFVTSVGLSAIALACCGLLMRPDALRAGEALRKRPSPPIIVLPLSKVEPERDVEARAWKSPYCLRWDDGCTQCERKRLGAKVSCETFQPNDCKRRLVFCTKRDDYRFVQVCTASDIIWFSQTKFDGSGLSFDEYRWRVENRMHGAEYIWKYKRRHWDWDGTGVLLRGGAQRSMEYTDAIRRDVCMEPWNSKWCALKELGTDCNGHVGRTR
jgi:hypothetical protein